MSRRVKRLETLTWVLIYSGLLLGCLAIFIARQNATVGWCLGAVAAIDVTIGVALIFLRSRIETPSGDPT